MKKLLNNFGRNLHKDHIHGSLDVITFAENQMPTNTKQLVRLHRQLLNDGQTVVLQGGARTRRPGTLAALFVGQRMLQEGKQPNVPAIVRELREQRQDAVGTELQYVGVYRGLVDYMGSKGIHRKACQLLGAVLDRHMRACMAAGVDSLPPPVELAHALLPEGT